MTTEVLDRVAAAEQLARDKKALVEAAEGELLAFRRELMVYDSTRGLAFKVPADVTVELNEKLRAHHTELQLKVDAALTELNQALKALVYEKGLYKGAN